MTSSSSRSQSHSRPPSPLFSRAEPPLYQIDLSRPPGERYTEICKDFEAEIAELAELYDSVLDLTPFPRLIGYLARACLRRVYSKEETAEISGISKITSVPIHFVVAYNTFLDLFSGCISGGARVQGLSEHGGGTGIVHFRGLDWEMERLRSMVIRVEYLRWGKVIARGVTYAGYVGVLTGVRKGLSISLNYRARINSTSSTTRHRVHQLLLLMGLRRSVSSHLRKILLHPAKPPSLISVQNIITKLTISPCFLTFCTPSNVLVIEKDLHTAYSRSSSEFLAVTNHDQTMETWTKDQWEETLYRENIPEAGREILDDSIERKRAMATLWGSALCSKPLEVKVISNWLKMHPLRNDNTHFSCLMDPAVEGGGLIWVEENVELLARESSSSGSRSPTTYPPTSSIDSFRSSPSAYSLPWTN